MLKLKADCLYGPSGSTKTSNVGRAALYFHKKYGTMTRLVTADGGGYEPIQSLVDSGIIEVFPILNRTFPIESMDWASQGYWPKDVDDPSSPMEMPDEKTAKDIGFSAFEGLTSFGDATMGKLKKDRAKLSQEAAFVYVESSEVGRAPNPEARELQTKKVLGQRAGSIAFAGGNMTYYGFIQENLYKWVMQSHQIPFVYKCLWTALEAKGEEEGTRIPIFGPSIAGKKAIGKAGNWFGNLLHLGLVVTEKGVNKDTKQLELDTKPVMYLRPHADPISKIVFPAKTRAPFQYALEVPHTFEPDLEKLYGFLAELHEKAKAELKKSVQTKS